MSSPDRIHEPLPTLPEAGEAEVELSIVMPCLDEVATLPLCIEKAQRALREHGISGEIVIGDNGSTDGSADVAARMGARVVHVAQKGYGNALRGAIAAARGRYVVMADSDDSYDLGGFMPFLAELRAGHDLVMGNRFRGGILPGAMPPLHRYLGNPLLSFIARLFFGGRIGDFHCGMRGFRRSSFQKLDLRTTGMEFASEMVIKMTLFGMSVAEVPTTLKKDGRSRPPHLRTWRDGWRHLRFMLLFSPLWLFVLPGALLLGLGAAAAAVLLYQPVRVGPADLDIHTLLYAAFSCLIGIQLINFGVFTKAFAVSEGLHPASPGLRRLSRIFTLEVGLAFGSICLLAGMILSWRALAAWSAVHFGPLDPRSSMRIVIPAATLMFLGMQMIFSSFLLSTLSLRRRR